MLQLQYPRLAFSIFASTVLAVVIPRGPPGHGTQRAARVTLPHVRASPDVGTAAGVPEPFHAPPRRRYVVAAIGDSITDTRVGGGKYMTELARLCPMSRFDAYGIGGQQTHHMLARFVDDLFGKGRRKGAPAYTDVIVLGGVNDLRAGSRLSDIEDHLATMYRLAHARGLGVIALTVPRWAPSSASERDNDDKLDAFILAGELRGWVDHAVDLRPALVCPDGMLCPRYRRSRGDTVHWSPVGHAAVAQAIQRAAFSDCE